MADCQRLDIRGHQDARLPGDEPPCTLTNLLSSNTVRLDRKYEGEFRFQFDGGLKDCRTHSQSPHKLAWFPSFPSQNHGKCGFNTSTKPREGGNPPGRERRGAIQPFFFYWSPLLDFYLHVSGQLKDAQSQRVYVWQSELHIWTHLGFCFCFSMFMLAE